MLSVDDDVLLQLDDVARLVDNPFFEEDLEKAAASEGFLQLPTLGAAAEQNAAAAAAATANAAASTSTAPLSLGDEVRAAAKASWLSHAQIFGILKQPAKYNLRPEQALAIKPPSGTLMLFSRNRIRGFRSDGHSWRMKRGDPNSIEESHGKLKIDGVASIQCYYSGTSDNKLLRRIYTLIDDPERDLALVQYLENSQPDKREQTAKSKALKEQAAERIAMLEARVKALELENNELKAASLPAGSTASLPVEEWRVEVVSSTGAAAAASSAGVVEIDALGDAPVKAPLPPPQPQPPPPQPLTVTALSPDWDAVEGGGTVLIAAQTEEGYRYAGCIEPHCIVPATLLLPNVLSIIIPPASTGVAACVEFRLLKLSVEDTNNNILSVSEPYPFTYREPQLAALTRGAVEPRMILEGLGQGHRGVTNTSEASYSSHGQDDSVMSNAVSEGDEEEDEEDDEELEAAAAEAAAEEAAEAEAKDPSPSAARSGADNQPIPREVYALALSLTSSFRASSDQQHALDEQFRMLITSLNQEGEAPAEAAQAVPSGGGAAAFDPSNNCCLYMVVSRMAAASLPPPPSYRPLISAPPHTPPHARHPPPPPEASPPISTY